MIERQHTLTPRQAARLIAAGKTYTHWEGCLHICQSIRYLSASFALSKQIIPFLIQCLQHPKGLVRVWALDALVHLSDVDPALVSLEKEQIKIAEALNKQAMDARIRNLLKTRLHFRISIDYAASQRTS